MQRIKLPTDYLLVLQRIARSGREDIMNLTESLRLDPKRLAHIIHALQHKGLIRLSKAGSDAWLSLSSKGRRLLQKLQPGFRPGYST